MGPSTRAAIYLAGILLFLAHWLVIVTRSVLGAGVGLPGNGSALQVLKVASAHDRLVGGQVLEPECARDRGMGDLAGVHVEPVAQMGIFAESDLG